jgi:hypothetical protein
MNIYHFLNGYPEIALTDAKTPFRHCRRPDCG